MCRRRASYSIRSISGSTQERSKAPRTPFAVACAASWPFRVEAPTPRAEKNGNDRRDGDVIEFRFNV